MADTRAFNLYFANRGQLPGEVLIESDEILVLRGSTVYRAAGIPDFAFASMLANSTETPIVTQNVFVSFEGTLIQGTTSTTFNFAANQFTYIGANQASPSAIKASMSILRASGGGSSAYGIGIFVNGVEVGTGMSVSSSSVDSGFVSTTVPHALQTGDIIDMRVQNVSDTEDLIVVDAQLVIS